MFSSFSAAASRSSTQGSGRWRDQDPDPAVVIQELSEEEEEKDNLSQGDTMPGSFERTCRELSVPWTEVVGKKVK